MSVSDEVLRSSPLFRRLKPPERAQVTAVARTMRFDRGERIFDEGDETAPFMAVLEGRVKVFKITPAGKEVILEIFGPGDPLGAVAVYEDAPLPASASALEPTSCLVIDRREFFRLLEQHPPLVRGLLSGLTLRLAELTRRLSEMTGTKVEARLARLFIKLAERLGEARGADTFVPLALSRQELADLTGTTIETCIRVMSRWHRDDLVRTEKDGFVIVDARALEALATS